MHQVGSIYKKANNELCLGQEISYENEKDIQQKLAKFSQILGIPYNTFKPTLVQQYSRIKVYNALAVPILLNRNKIWTIKKKGQKRSTSIEMKFFIRTAGYTLLSTKKMKKF